MRGNKERELGGRTDYQKTKGRGCGLGLTNINTYVRKNESTVYLYKEERFECCF